LLTGFLIATLKPAPPVYDPGGPSCDIDDFAVTPAARWPTTGVRLSLRARSHLRVVGDAAGSAGQL